MLFQLGNGPSPYASPPTWLLTRDPALLPLPLTTPELNKAREDLGWLSSWVSVRTQRETLLRKRSPGKKYRVDCSQEMFPFPLFL